MDGTSGDAGWWYGFSSLSTPGTYFIYDHTNDGRSSVFAIAERIYSNILKDALHLFYCERAAIAKTTPYAQSYRLDGAALAGPRFGHAALLSRRQPVRHCLFVGHVRVRGDQLSQGTFQFDELE